MVHHAWPPCQSGHRLLVLGLNAGLGMELTEELSAGATVTVGTGFSQLGLVESTAMVHDYALRGTLGLAYDLNTSNTVGTYYQTKLGFTFPNAFRLPDGTYRDISIDQPETFGLGWANRDFLEGDLLLAADVYYKLWEGANLWAMSCTTSGPSPSVHNSREERRSIDWATLTTPIP